MTQTLAYRWAEKPRKTSNHIFEGKMVGIFVRRGTALFRYPVRSYYVCRLWNSPGSRRGVLPLRNIVQEHSLPMFGFALAIAHGRLRSIRNSCCSIVSAQEHKFAYVWFCFGATEQHLERISGVLPAILPHQGLSACALQKHSHWR
jgi:hypothetical protein